MQIAKIKEIFFNIFEFSSFDFLKTKMNLDNIRKLTLAKLVIVYLIKLYLRTLKNRSIQIMFINFVFSLSKFTMQLIQFIEFCC